MLSSFQNKVLCPTTICLSDIEKRLNLLLVVRLNVSNVDYSTLLQAGGGGGGAILPWNQSKPIEASDQPGNLQNDRHSSAQK
jgi:hypothetical protein